MNEPAAPHDPFAALGLEPTLEPARVKRAYFAAVAQNPPYRDADAFARIRAAYEALSRPGGLESAYLAAPDEVSRELSALRERYAPALAEARQSQDERREREERVPAFIEAAASTPLAAFIARYRGRS